MKKKTICIFCASSSRIDDSYKEAAHKLGTMIASQGHALICGAGRAGLMGQLIDGANSAGGETIGIIPQFMVEKGWHHRGLSQMIVTNDMHERKKLMAQSSDAIITLPGGCGTLEELTEIITARQLGLYNGNIIILNLNGYYTPLLDMFSRAAKEGFIRPGQSASLWNVAATVEEAFEMAISDSIETEIIDKY